jgi:hypothetical protein
VVSDVDSILKSAENPFLSALFGFLAALATFRARFTLIDAKHETLRAELLAAREHDRELLRLQLEALRTDIKRSERLQTVVLELVSSLASKHGVTHRALGSDALAEILTKEAQ